MINELLAYGILSVASGILGSLKYKNEGKRENR